MYSLEGSKTTIPIANEPPPLLTATFLQAAEAGIVPQAAPLQDLAPDEDDTPHHFQETDHNENIGYYSDPEAGHGSDDDDDYSITVSPLWILVASILTHSDRSVQWTRISSYSS